MEARLYYDGHCALCHGAVSFAVRRDRGRPPVRFAPIGGESFGRMLEARGWPDLPDTLLVETGDGELWVRSEAVLYLLRRAGGPWRLLAFLAKLVPRVVRDGFYDLVARHRRGWFGRTEEECPLLPERLRRRFDA